MISDHQGDFWKPTTLERCGKWISGGTPSRDRSDFWDGTIPWISAKSMNCIRLSDSHERVTLLGAENGTRYAPKGSILILVRGSMLHQRIPIGITTKDVTFNQDVKAIVPALDVLPEFLLYWLLSNESKLLEMVEFTGIGAGKLSTDLLYNMKVKLPSLPEQRAIAHILSTLDDKIELNRRMNETLEAIARALFKSWFVDFDPVRDKAEGREPAGMDAETAALFPDSFEETELGEVPKGWSVTGIYDVAEVIYGAPFSSKRFNDKGNGLPLLRIRDLATQEPQIFTTENHPRGTKVKQGDVIVGMDGEFKVHLWSGPISWLNQRVCMFVPKEGVPSFFVMLSLEEPLAFFERSKVGTTVIHLGKSDIDSFKIIIPNREVLRVFSVLVDPICKKIILNSNESRILATIRDALLLKLLNGDLHAGIKYIIRRTL